MSSNFFNSSSILRKFLNDPNWPEPDKMENTKRYKITYCTLTGERLIDYREGDSEEEVISALYSELFKWENISDVYSVEEVA